MDPVMWILLIKNTNINKQIYKNMFQINENIESGICYVDFAYHKKHISTSKKIEYAIWILQMLESVMWILQCHIVFFSYDCCQIQKCVFLFLVLYNSKKDSRNAKKRAKNRYQKCQQKDAKSQQKVIKKMQKVNINRKVSSDPP